MLVACCTGKLVVVGNLDDVRELPSDYYSPGVIIFTFSGIYTYIV
jgi:hypothetical protein